MEKKNFSTLFSVVMILLLIPFIPALVEGKFSEENKFDNFSTIQTTQAASQSVQVSDFIAAGFIGQYGLNPIIDHTTPQVMGISTETSGTSPPYQAKEVDRSNSVLNLNPGQAVTVWVDFLNSGRATWYNSGDHFVALNTAGPAGRESTFQHDYWKEYYYRPARLLQNEVRPGQTGRFRFALQAPMEVGQYFEEFHIVAEDATWIDGGYTSFYIGVGENVSRPPDFQAQVVERSIGEIIKIDPGDTFTFWVDFQNTGLQNWHNSGDHFIAINVTDAVGRVSVFKHDYWNEYYYRPAKLMQSRVYPGETGRFRFALQAPNVDGYYTEKFALVSENLTWINGGEIILQFKVGEPPVPTEPLSYSIENEPTVRIGLYNSEALIQLTANGAYSVINMNNDDVVLMEPDKPATINYSTDAYWRIVPQDVSSIIEITNYSNKPIWNSDLNDNMFRGVIEIRYSEQAEEMWVINELPLESYLAGLAEVANEQPEEYLKSLTIAARSYVLWHTLHGGKHASKYFDINAVTDQVYRGYGFEQRSEDPLLAVQATAGQVITHPGAISEINPQGVAIAAYSSGTDGRTRAWSEVWAGSGFPWFISVADPYGILPNWDTLEGNHMVGMSALGARGYATEEGKTYDWILKYYYTGVAVEKIY